MGPPHATDARQGRSQRPLPKHRAIPHLLDRCRRTDHQHQEDRPCRRRGVGVPVTLTIKPIPESGDEASGPDTAAHLLWESPSPDGEAAEGGETDPWAPVTPEEGAETGFAHSSARVDEAGMRPCRIRHRRTGKEGLVAASKRDRDPIHRHGRAGFRLLLHLQPSVSGLQEDGVSEIEELNGRSGRPGRRPQPPEDSGGGAPLNDALDTALQRLPDKTDVTRLIEIIEEIAGLAGISPRRIEGKDISAVRPDAGGSSTATPFASRDQGPVAGRHIGTADPAA